MMKGTPKVTRESKAPAEHSENPKSEQNKPSPSELVDRSKVASPVQAANALANDEAWTPKEQNLHGDWHSGHATSHWRALPALEAEPGATALAGQVLTLNGDPLPKVTLDVEGKTAQTDNTGRFLLVSPPPGHHEMLIDGRTAGNPGTTYGVFEVGLSVTSGRTNVLPYTIWMPKIDTAHAVTIPSPATSEVVITTPRIPGLEVHIPPQTVILDHEGKASRGVRIAGVTVVLAHKSSQAAIALPLAD